MTPLCPDAHAIVEAARRGDDPSEADRARVRKSLMLKIAAGVGATTVATSTGAATAAATSVGSALGLGAGVSSIVPKGLAVLLLLGAGAGVGYRWVEHSDRDSVPRAHAVTASLALLSRHAPPIPPPRSDDQEASGPATTASAVGPARTAPPQPPAADRGPSTLESEIQALRHAHAELRAGRANKAVEVLEAQDVDTKAAVLDQEREAMRVFALCRLGRSDEARRLAESFLARWPESPLATRVRSACRVASDESRDGDGRR